MDDLTVGNSLNIGDIIDADLRVSNHRRRGNGLLHILYMDSG